MKMYEEMGKCRGPGEYAQPPGYTRQCAGTLRNFFVNLCNNYMQAPDAQSLQCLSRLVMLVQNTSK